MSFQPVTSERDWLQGTEADLVAASERGIEIWPIRFTFADVKSNQFLTIGGALFLSEETQKEAWNQVPHDPDPAATIILDRIDPYGDVIDDKLISKSVAESLLGEPLETVAQRALEELQKEFEAALAERRAPRLVL